MSLADTLVVIIAFASLVMSGIALWRTSKSEAQDERSKRARVLGEAMALHRAIDIDLLEITDTLDERRRRAEPWLAKWDRVHPNLNAMMLAGPSGHGVDVRGLIDSFIDLMGYVDLLSTEPKPGDVDEARGIATEVGGHLNVVAAIWLGPPP